MGNRKHQEAYRNFVNQGVDQDTTEFYRLKQTPAVLGDKQFRENAQIMAKSLDREIDKKGLRYPVPLTHIIRRVADYYQVSEQGIKLAKRGRRKANIPRWIAMKLCQEIGGAKLTDIAKLFEAGHYTTVSQTIGRLNRSMSESTRYEKNYNILSQDLTPQLFILTPGTKF